MTTVFEWLNEKYVQNADERQSKMGLQYMTAETHDLAEMIYKYQKQPLLKRVDELEESLEWILSSFKNVLAGKSVRDADESICHIEKLLENK